jgi:RNA polymerase I-specific transcription initiation factor RRN3
MSCLNKHFHPFTESPYTWASPDLADSVTVRKSAERQHLLLHTLLELVPTLPSTLMPILSRGFPAKRAPRADHVVYMTNALKVVEYCPPVASEIWRHVVDRAIKMDLDIQMEIDELEDEEGGLDEAIFGFDASQPFDKQLGDDDGSDSDSDEDDGATLDLDNISDDEEPEDADDDRADVPATEGPNPEAIARIKQMAAKLDAVLRVIFDHLERTRQSPTLLPPPSSNSVSQIDLFRRRYDDAALSQTLLSLFDSQLLPTFSTHHVQFLLFYHSSVSPDFTDAFIGLLLNHALFDGSTPVVTKVAAASYVASFVSRARHVGKDEVRRVMGLLSGWCEDWLDGVLGGPRNAAVFYAVVQASLYLFCFRWKDFLEEDDEAEAGISVDLGLGGGGRRWSQELDGVHRIVGSSMNPLKVGLAGLETSQRDYRLKLNAFFHE